MKRRAVIRVIVLCMTAFLCGCKDTSELTATVAEVREPSVKTEVMIESMEENSEEMPDEHIPAESEGLPAEDLVEESAEEVIVEVEKEEPLLYPHTDYDYLPSDTVKYTESDKEEITEKRYVESVVKEDDPSTFKVVQTEKEVTVTEEVPAGYLDTNGNEIYTYSDGIWYGHKYSTGDITLGAPDEDLALFFLNLDGFYDDYIVEDVTCTELMVDGEELQYQYHVLYHKTSALEGEPSNTEGLTVSKTRTVTNTRKEIVEEKVPVLLEEEIGTGEYIYSGWQKFDDERYYFDKNGEMLTGSHVIKGIHYIFDEDGVKISDNGIYVSEQNGAIDWKQVRTAKIDHAVIRAAYRGCGKGELIRDSRFEENIIGARRAGIDVGLSIYSQAVNEEEILEEAALVLELAKTHQISRPLMIVSSYGDADYRGRADGLNAGDRTGLVKLFCEKIRETGYTPMVCAEKGWLEHCLDAEALEEYPICIIQYNTNVTYTGAYEVWQYTSSGKVDGISGNIGLSIGRIK